VILQDGIAAIPSALVHYQGALELSAQQVWFVSYILAHKWDEDLPYPSLKAMSRRVGMSLSQLQRIKNSLCHMGMLAVYPRFGDNQGQATNAYDFSGLFDRLEQLIMQDAPLPNGIRLEQETPPDMAELGEVDPSFVARYGRVITRRGVAAVPRAIFTHQAELKLTPQQVWFITYIFSHQWDTALPYPSLRKMASLTGYSSVQLHTIKAELVEVGYLRLVHRSNDTGGQDTNAYDFSGLLDAIRAMLQPESATKSDHGSTWEDDAKTQVERPQPRRRGRKVHTNGHEPGSIKLPARGSVQLTRGDRTELPDPGSIQAAGGGSIEFTGRGRTQLPAGDGAELSARGGSQLAGGDSTEFTEPGRNRLAKGGRANWPKAGKRRHVGGTSAAYVRGIARDVHEVESEHVEAVNKIDDSNHIAPVRKTKTNGNDTTPPPYSPYIASVISDFSLELNDPTHIISNVTQALRIWQTSQMNEEEFTQLLYEAKRLTRTYQGKNGLAGIGNKMAYFFKVVRDLCSEED
jgi:AraC-like DNA-binding protein